MPQHKTQWKNRIFSHEKNNLPSKTQPDQTMSIPELIKRYASGQSLGGYKIPIYESQEQQEILNGKDFRTLDLSEQHQLMREVAEEVQNLRTPKVKHKKNSENEIIVSDKTD
jgi:hypothetical protein